nr:MAG TPA: hypothetical protein [Herelleviridae sp.]
MENTFFMLKFKVSEGRVLPFLPIQWLLLTI